MSLSKTLPKQNVKTAILAEPVEVVADEEVLRQTSNVRREMKSTDLAARRGLRRATMLDPVQIREASRSAR